MRCSGIEVPWDRPDVGDKGVKLSCFALSSARSPTASNSRNGSEQLPDCTGLSRPLAYRSTCLSHRHLRLIGRQFGPAVPGDLALEERRFQSLDTFAGDGRFGEVQVREIREFHEVRVAWLFVDSPTPYSPRKRKYRPMARTKPKKSKSRRTHRCDRARSREQFHWPIAYFAKQGLFSLVATHAQVVQSSLR